MSPGGGQARAALPSVGVLLASAGKPCSDVAISRAAELAQGERVRVVTIARIHGSSFGLQHPGPMPSQQEKDAARALVAHAISAQHQAGAKADGEVVITRSAGRSLAKTARTAGAARVVIDDTNRTHLARINAWFTARYLRRRLKDIDLAAV